MNGRNTDLPDFRERSIEGRPSQVGYFEPRSKDAHRRDVLLVGGEVVFEAVNGDAVSRLLLSSALTRDLRDCKINLVEAAALLFVEELALIFDDEVDATVDRRL